MRVANYAIFSGSPGKRPLWLEAVEGLATARVRMEQHAKEKPGPYFVICPETRQVVAFTDTTPPPAAHTIKPLR